MIRIVIPHLPNAHNFSCWLGQFSYISCCMYNIKRWIQNSGCNFAYTAFVCWCKLWHLKLYIMCIYKSWHIGCVTKNMSIKLSTLLFFSIQIIIHMPNTFSFYLPPGFRLNLVLLGRYQQMCESNRNTVQ